MRPCARFIDYDPATDETTYIPVVVIFGLSALMALAVAWGALGTVVSVRTVEWFAAFAMTVLAIQKLRDVESFSTMFLNYDLLAQRYVPYAYMYPVGEAAAGVLMIAGGVLGVIGAPIALFIGTVGAVSVYKAVYVDKRELKCACVGGDTNVPLGFVSLTENMVMMAMGSGRSPRLWLEPAITANCCQRQASACAALINKLDFRGVQPIFRWGTGFET